ncbi:MAG: hypothetical protein RLY49_318 [Candidatus Parcubacteria bacterium]|jgi:hypothetical protein
MTTPEGIQFEQNQDAKLVELKERIADAFQEIQNYIFRIN